MAATKERATRKAYWSRLMKQAGGGKAQDEKAETALDEVSGI